MRSSGLEYKVSGYGYFKNGGKKVNNPSVILRSEWRNTGIPGYLAEGPLDLSQHPAFSIYLTGIH